MTDAGAKADLQRYLQAARDALLWKLEGLSEYDVRRPMTPTGTNLLGLVKHLAYVEMGYFGADVRPAGARGRSPWLDDDGRAQRRHVGHRARSRARTSSRCTAGRGRTPTPRSRRCRWTPPGGCRGGARPARR